MDRYQRVEKPREDTQINENEIRITTQGRIRSYITYATTLLQEKGSNEIVFKAMGRAINKTVMIVELIKRRIVGLHQNTAIGSTDITDTWEPLEEGLLPLETTRHVSMITITLSKKEIDASSVGYLPPIPKEQVKPLVEFDYEADGSPSGRGRGRGARNRGRGRGNGNMAMDHGDGGWDNRGRGNGNMVADHNDGGWNNRGRGYGGRGGRTRGSGHGYRGRGREGYGDWNDYQQENNGYNGGYSEFEAPNPGQTRGCGNGNMVADYNDGGWDNRGRGYGGWGGRAYGRSHGYRGCGRGGYGGWGDYQQENSGYNGGYNEFEAPNPGQTRGRGRGRGCGMGQNRERGRGDFDQMG